MLSNEYLVAKIGFDTEENEPLKVCQMNIRPLQADNASQSPEPGPEIRNQVKVRVKSLQLWRARSLLYRSQSLQVNTHWKAFFEIYKIHTPSHRSELEKSIKNCNTFLFFHEICYFFVKMIVFQADFHEISPEICEIFTEFQEVIANFPEIQQNQWKSFRFCKICTYLDSISIKFKFTWRPYLEPSIRIP